MKPSIVSLLPSATEVVCALGLRDQLVGVSHECDYPPEVTSLPRLSRPKVNPLASSAEIDSAVRSLAHQAISLYDVDAEALGRLAPDVILTQDHCRVCAVSIEDVEAAACAITNKETTICTLHPGSLADVRRDFVAVASACGAEDAGAELLRAFDARLQLLAEQVAALQAAGGRRPRVACLEWLDPVMVGGGWIPELVELAGGEPVIVTRPDRFATVTWADIEAADPDVVVLMPCGFDIERTLGELDSEPLLDAVLGLRATREGRCWVVDGNAHFNRSGPRLADSAEILASIFYPDAFEPQEAALQWGDIDRDS